MSDMSIALSVSDIHLTHSQPIDPQEAGKCCQIYIIISNILITA